MRKIQWPAVHAWALYDFAATAFSMNVISTYFALWVVQDQGGSDLTYGLAKSISMLAVVLLSPLLGGWSDLLGRRRPFLFVCVAVFVALTFTLGATSSLWLGLVLFGLANLGFQLSLVFYNAMLAGLAPAEQLGRVSGYGKMIGYVGSLSAVLLGMAFASGKLFGHVMPWGAGGSQAVFGPTAALCLLAAAPLLLRREAVATQVSHSPVRWGALLAELRDDKKLPGVGLFLLASFFFFDTINTIRDFMSIYMVKVVGLTEGGSLQNFLLIVVLCSLVGALGWGFAADRFGPKRALVGVLVTMGVGFAGLLVLKSPALVLGVIGPILGIAFGGVLVTARPLLARLVPFERQGEFFGVFIVANDCAAILGPLSWGAIVELLKAQGVIAYQAAIGCQLLFLLVGLALLLRVAEPPAVEASAPADAPRAASS